MIKEIITKIFEGVISDNVKETFSTYEIKYKCSDLNKLSSNLSKSNYDALSKILSELSYKWNLYIEDLGYSISQDEYEEIKISEDESSTEALVIFTIHKEGDKILIINEGLFNDFIIGIDLESVLEILKNKSFPLVFIGSNYEIEIGNKSEQKKTFALSKQCNFRNYSQYPFSPDYFYINDVEGVDSSNLIEFISKISLVYSLIFIFDSTEINRDEIGLSISGLKTLKYSLNFKNLNNKLLKHYYRIYNWIYSEENKIEDKIGLSRNILTAYLKESNIDIDESVFSSILSSNQIYVKGNISKYFEVRNKITEQVEQTVTGVSKSIESFSNNFQKSSFVFISFFLSVFIFKIVNKKSDIDKIFTQETSLIGIGFILISIAFLIASIRILNIDVNRLKKRYNNVKKRFEDVLVKQDIDKILNEDYEYNNEINYLNKRTKTFTILWIVTIIIFTTILFLTSDYLEVSSVLEFLKPTSEK